MSTDSRFANAVNEHRRAVEECAAAIRTVDPAIWNRAPAEGKWSPALLAEHLAIAYDPPLAELAGGEGFRIVLPPWKRMLARWIYLPRILEGRFPRGARAPREVRPTAVSADPETAARKLSLRSEKFLSRFAEAAAGPKRIRLTHAYFGRISAYDVLRILTAHARHHQTQLPPA